MPVPRKSPLKGGSIPVFNEILFMSENKPPFRGDGGLAKRETNSFHGCRGT